MTIRVAFRMVTPRTWTGGTNYLLNICRVLRAHAPEFEPVFFAPPDIDRRTVDTIIASTGAPPLPLQERTHKHDMLAIAGIREKESVAAFASANIDLVFESTGYYGPRPPFPILSWIPDFQHRHLPQLFSYRAWLTREVRYRSILSKRKHILLSSENARSDMVFFYGHQNTTVHVAPFAVCIEHFPSFEESECVRLAYGLPERFIFLPNQFWAHKNHKIVVEALGILNDSAPVIVTSGGGDDRSPKLLQELQSRLAALNIVDRFRRLGNLPYSDVLALNVRADALLNPSLFEGWSTTVEEARALGTPMILSDLPVHREQVAGNAIFFNPHSAKDCAGALQAAISLPPRKPADGFIATNRNDELQRTFASRLRTAFMAVMEDAA